MDLMMTKEEIEKAVEQSKHVERDYPEFYKFYLMLMELVNNKPEVVEDGVR